MTASLQIAAGRMAGVISAVGFVPYAVAVVRGRAQPNAATWLIWTVIGAVLCASYWAAGARAAVWVSGSYVLGPLVMSVLALKYGERGFSRFDKGCLAAGLVSLGLWALTGNPLLALGLNVVVDLLGALPTIRKAWHDPESEDRLSWGLFVLGNAVNLVAVEAWTLGGAMYPAYLFLVTLSVNALLWRPRPRALVP